MVNNVLLPDRIRRLAEPKRASVEKCVYRSGKGMAIAGACRQGQQPQSRELLAHLLSGQPTLLCDDISEVPPSPPVRPIQQLLELDKILFCFAHQSFLAEPCCVRRAGDTAHER